jgi:hypothetical protein
MVLATSLVSRPLMQTSSRSWLATVLAATFSTVAVARSPAAAPFVAHPTNAWKKLSPLGGTPVSPRLGYEGACVWDRRHQLLVRYGGHNQGGGGEQGAEVWTFDLRTAYWTLQEPNLSPPGVCCNAQNVFDPGRGRYLRFPLFSGNHGWQWWRELSLNDSSVWTYDLGSNTWRNRRPLPAPRLAGLRCASWDSDEEVVVVFGGEGSQEGTLIYDPHANEWRWPRPKPQPDFRSGGQMAYDAARRVHVMFGSQFSDDPHTWLYDVKRNQWRDARPARMPPTQENDAVLTYDPVSQVVLALVKTTTGQDDSALHRVETWAYDAGANEWTKLNPACEPDSAGNRTRQLIFAPELNLAILENCPSKPRQQQIWTYRYAEARADLNNGLTPPKPRTQPRLVEDAVVSVLSPTRVELNWTAPDDPSVTGYHLERAAVEVLTEDQLTRLKRNTPPLPEPSVGALRRIGPFRRLTTAPVPETTFVDTTVDLSKAQPVSAEPVYDRVLHAEQLDAAGRPYRFAVCAYRIRAVNGAGVDSGPSPALLTIPSPPQWLFSKEDGTTCRLRWAANPERGLTGYRVYRMDNRWDKDPISRLTPEPVRARTFADPAAGKSTRRYYVVAIDALGQEGFPSSPVWFQREWRQYYAPFVGEWHQ